MKTLKFKCTLLSDVILNQKAASEGANNTLDFIPGSNFLGIVAAKYGEFGDDAVEVFHSGKVRFGDAHPVCKGHENMRTLRVPASMYYPKLNKASEVCYIHHEYDRKKDQKGDGNQPQQLKQCRQGFYAFDGDAGYKAETAKNYALKSAYDRVTRRSKDSQMFGYEALDKDAEFYFSVEVDTDELAGKIRDALAAEHNRIHNIGRSRTAQYGLVEIKECGFEETTSRNIKADDNGDVTVYADGRLIFLDENGEPTFRPMAEDLGLDSGEIDWERSQVRTFQYAPWNGKRKTRDADRCGVEKGSVFVVTGCKAQDLKSQYVGVYRNEGFGRVIYNPEFLDTADGATNGQAKFKLKEGEGKPQPGKPKQIPNVKDSDHLLKYVNRAISAKEADEYIRNKVNKFVGDNAGRYSGERFASQWGAIRTIAMQYKSHDEIWKQLFTKTKIKHEDRGSEAAAYLTHGVAKDKWSKGGRKKALEDFIEEINSKENMTKYGDITAKALINLASEMAKICKNKEQ